MCGNFPAPGDVSTTDSQAKLTSEKYLMLLQNSVPSEGLGFLSETTSAYVKQRARTANHPLPALAKEVLWYGHEKSFKKIHNIPLSPFIVRYQRLAESLDKNNIVKTPPVPGSFTLWIEEELQDAKQKKIAQLVSNQIKEFEEAHGNNDRSIMPRQFEGSIWFNESYDDAIIDYYDARRDSIELNDLRARAWEAGARWRYAEFSEHDF